MTHHTSLQGKFYPIRTLLPSCILLQEANGNNFEQKLQFINTLSRFHGLEFEDAYFFIREFKEVCLMMRIPQLGDDAVRLRFIPVSLKNLAKKWLYSLQWTQSLLGTILLRFSTRNSTWFIRLHWLGKTSCNSKRIQWAFLEIFWMIHRYPSTMPSPRYREMAAMLDSLWWTGLSKENIVGNYVPKGFL